MDCCALSPFFSITLAFTNNYSLAICYSAMGTSHPRRAMVTALGVLAHLRIPRIPLLSKHSQRMSTQVAGDAR